MQEDENKEEPQTSVSKRGRSLFFFIFTVLIILVIAYYNGKFKNPPYSNSVVITQQTLSDSESVSKNAIEPSTHSFILTEQAKTHILYGDKTGGGHIYGSKRPCKSIFPKDWDAEKIISTVETLAANDNLNWQQQRNGRHVAEDNIDNVMVRVVMGENRTKVITSYPLNAERTPCPSKKIEKQSPVTIKQESKKMFDNIKFEYKYNHNP